MRTADETVRYLVKYPSGICGVRMPWHASDHEIIRRAISLMPKFMAPEPEDCTVEREDTHHA